MSASTSLTVYNCVADTGMQLLKYKVLFMGTLSTGFKTMFSPKMGTLESVDRVLLSCMICAIHLFFWMLDDVFIYLGKTSWITGKSWWLACTTDGPARHMQVVLQLQCFGLIVMRWHQLFARECPWTSCLVIVNPNCKERIELKDYTVDASPQMLPVPAKLVASNVIRLGCLS